MKKSLIPHILPHLRCLRCGYQWVPRVVDVLRCPKCKHPRWNQEPKERHD